MRSAKIHVSEALEETRSEDKKRKLIRFKAPKSEAGKRSISLPDIVVDVLRDLKRQVNERRLRLGMGKLPDDALIFPRQDGKPQSPKVFSSDWAAIAASIGHPEITFHALRHTHASHLIASGIDVVTIAHRLGHAKPTITLATYVHLFRKRDDKSSQAINDVVKALFR